MRKIKKPTQKRTKKLTTNYPLIVLLIGIIILCGVIVLCTARQRNMWRNSFLYSKSFSEMHRFSWKRYINRTLGISFQYPKSFGEIHEATNQVLIQKGMTSPFVVNKIITSETVDEWWNRVTTDPKSNAIPSTKTLTTFHNEIAYLFKPTRPMQTPMHFYAIKRNGYILIVSFQVDETGKNETFQTNDKPIIQGILDSIRFY